MTEDARPVGGELAATISNRVVHELANTTGRGPTKARTTIGQNAVFVVLEDTLTRGERVLVGAGEGETVAGLRRAWQRVMRDSCTPQIEELTNRKVVGFLSDDHIDPDIAVEVFVLEPRDRTVRAAIVEANHPDPPE